MLVMADVSLDRDDANASDIDIPAIDVVAFRNGIQDARVYGVGVDNFDFGESNALLEARRRADAGYHHELDQLLGLNGQLPALRLLETVFGRGYVLGSKGLEKLQS